MDAPDRSDKSEANQQANCVGLLLCSNSAKPINSTKCGSSMHRTEPGWQKWEKVFLIRAWLFCYSLGQHQCYPPNCWTNPLQTADMNTTLCWLSPFLNHFLPGLTSDKHPQNLTRYLWCSPVSQWVSLGLPLTEIPLSLTSPLHSYSTHWCSLVQHVPSTLITAIL